MPPLSLTWRMSWRSTRAPTTSVFPRSVWMRSGKQLVTEKLHGLPMQLGQPERYDDSYEPGEMDNLFLACEPLAGKRFVSVTERHTSQDWAHFLREVVDSHYP